MSNLKTKPSRLYRHLSAAITEMKQIERGERAPSRQWEIVPDGKGGFIRRQVTAAKTA